MRCLDQTEKKIKDLPAKKKSKLQPPADSGTSEGWEDVEDGMQWVTQFSCFSTCLLVPG